MYCDMHTERCGIKGGWTRVAYFDVRNAACPSGDLLLDTYPQRMCRRRASGCASIIYQSNGVSYSNVCGRVTGYASLTVDALAYYRPGAGLDSVYVDGISITHGSPRKHVWTFATDHEGSCRIKDIPFIGEDIYCENTDYSTSNRRRLWDGQGCRLAENCQRSGQPWFCHTVPIVTNDYLEVRVCQDSDENNERVALEQVEIYVY